MYPFGHGMLGRDREINKFETCWQILTFGFKAMFGLAFITNILSVLTPYGDLNIVFPPQYDEEVYHPWNLLTSFTTSGTSLKSLFGFLIDFYILFFIWQGLEQKFSTVYMLFQPFIQTLTVNLIFAPVAFGIFKLGFPPNYLLNARWSTVIIIFMFKNVCYKPDEYIKYCWVPFLLKNKYVPLIKTILFLAFRYDQWLPILISYLIGYIQSYHLKTDFIKLPMSAYNKIQTWIPKFISFRSDFVLIRKVSRDLRDFTSLCCINNHQTFEGNPCVVEVTGGVSLGGNQKNKNEDYRKKWNENQNLPQISKDEIEKQIQQKSDEVSDPSSSNNIKHSKKIAINFEEQMKIDDEMFQEAQIEDFEQDGKDKDGLIQ